MAHHRSSYRRYDGDEVLPSGISLSGVFRSLAGRAAIVRRDDPVIPWVSRVADAVFQRMKADAEGDLERLRLAEEEYSSIVEEASETAERWKEEGRPDLVRRLSLLLKTPL